MASLKASTLLFRGAKIARSEKYCCREQMSVVVVLPISGYTRWMRSCCGQPGGRHNSRGRSMMSLEEVVWMRPSPTARSHEAHRLAFALNSGDSVFLVARRLTVSGSVWTLCQNGVLIRVVLIMACREAFGVTGRHWRKSPVLLK